MTDRPAGVIVAVDGPAASGKSSTARAVAAVLGYRHLDSGAFYRALTLAALERGIPPERWPALSWQDLDDLAVDAIPIEGSFVVRIGGAQVGDRIRSTAVDANVSTMAAVPAVREWLMGALREAGRDGRLVADGRDIGTAVFPDAELKIFLVCEPEERARRRLREQREGVPSAAEIAAEARRLIERDRLDQSRQWAPLVRAADAVLLDTTHLAFDDQVESIARLARRAASG